MSSMQRLKAAAAADNKSQPQEFKNRPGCIQVIIERAGARQHILGQHNYEEMRLAKVQQIDFVVDATATNAVPALLRLRIGNADCINTAKDNAQPVYADYLTIAIPPTAATNQVIRNPLDLTIGNLFISKKLPVDAFFTLLNDVAVDFTAVVGTRGFIVVYLEHGVQ